MSRPPSAGEVLAIFGRRGSGKTHLARRLVAQLPRLVVFDPIGEWAPDARPVEGVEGVLAAMRRSWRSFRVSLPVARLWPRELHRLARLLWDAQAPVGSPPLWLVVDELSLSYPVRPLPAALWGMPRLVLQGRHRRIGILGIAQRPALVSADFRGQVHRLVSFALPSSIDRGVVAQQLGSQWAAPLAQLRPFQFLEQDQDGAVKRGGPPLTGSQPRPAQPRSRVHKPAAANPRAHGRGGRRFKPDRPRHH